jgi:glyoxylase-like metal-dependent hydrolase (beta-lactamase superfamily II)
MTASVTTIDCDYLEEPGFAAAYLVREGERAAFVETNTAHAVPRMLAALRDAGLTPEQVELVVITHVHLDHAGGASALMAACPNATLLAHPRAAKHVVDPSKLVESARQVYGAERFERLYGVIEPVPEARVRVMQDGETARLGARTLTFLHTRGHAEHHACIVDSGSNGIFTGDSFGLVYPALQHRGLFAIPSTSPTDFDADAALASLERIVAAGAERAYLTHFGEQRDLPAIAAQLRPQIEAHGAIADAADAQGLEGDALDAYCDREVRALFHALLARHDLDDAASRALLETDVALNGQGVAAAVRKRRFKRGG